MLADHPALKGFKDDDWVAATGVLKSAFRTDVEPILGMVRLEKGGAIDPVAAYRASGYRKRVAAERPAAQAGGGGSYKVVDGS